MKQVTWSEVRRFVKQWDRTNTHSNTKANGLLLIPWGSVTSVAERVGTKILTSDGVTTNKKFVIRISNAPVSSVFPILLTEDV